MSSECQLLKKSAFQNAKLTQTFLYINSALFTFKNPIFEYKIGRGSEPQRATEPRKEKH